MKLEEELACRWGGYWLPITNGTIAIQIMAITCLPHYSRVAIPDFTFAATGLALMHAGMRPVIFSCTDDYASFDLELLEKKHEEYDAILVVSPFGYNLPIKELKKISQKYNKKLLADFAGAFPMSLEDSPCSYSLHAAKSLPIGEGGLIRFNKYQDYLLAKRLICFDFDQKKSSLSPLGMNAKMDEFRCALVRAQLVRWNDLLLRIIRHRDLITSYQEAIESKDPIFHHTMGYPSLCVLRGLPTKKIIEHGRKKDIVFRKYYSPFLSEMSAFSAVKKYGNNSPKLNTYLAFPSDLEVGEFEPVVDCVLDVIS